MTNACCIGHPCDNCGICRSGVCCMTVQAAQVRPVQQSSDLHVAICHEIGTADGSDLGELLRVELVISGRPGPSAVLPAADAETVALFIQSPEEVPYAEVACPPRR
jgi:hypothetical protein